MKKSNKISKAKQIKSAKTKKQAKKNRQLKYITKLAEDLRTFKERILAGEQISQREKRNIRARELRAMKKMKEDTAPLISEANRVLKLMESEGIKTLAQQRVYDDFMKLGRTEFTLNEAKNYQDIVAEITRAKTFLNSPDTNVLTGSRTQRNRGLQKKYASQLDSLKSGDYVAAGLIATEDEAKQIFKNYRKIEETWQGRVGKQGQKGVYGSENLILYMIDVHNQGLDELEYGQKALENFDIEQLPEFKELISERNKVTGISGLFQKGGLYGKLAGLL